MKTLALLILPFLVACSSESKRQSTTPERQVAPAEASTIVDVAEKAGSFKTLLTAVKAADLESVLRSEGPFTVFAPTDEAFAKIPGETLQALIADKEALKNVLLYHVVAGAKVESKVAVTLTEAKMANGQFVSLALNGATLFVNSSAVTAVDIPASNGIIHVIDSVLLPK